MRSVTRPESTSSRWRIRSIERSRIVTCAPRPSAITATKALTNATLPYVEAIADHGLAEAVARDPMLGRGVNVLHGKVTYEAVADAHGLDYAPLEDVLPLSPV